jgi:hypothetical protein
VKSFQKIVNQQNKSQKPASGQQSQDCLFSDSPDSWLQVASYSHSILTLIHTAMAMMVSVIIPAIIMVHFLIPF